MSFSEKSFVIMWDVVCNRMELRSRSTGYRLPYETSLPLDRISLNICSAIVCYTMGNRWPFYGLSFAMLWESLSVRRTSFVILWDIVCHSAGYRLLFYGMSIVILWYIVRNHMRRRSVSKRLGSHILLDKMFIWALLFVVERNPAEVDAMSLRYPLEIPYIPR